MSQISTQPHSIQHLLCIILEQEAWLLGPVRCDQRCCIIGVSSHKVGADARAWGPGHVTVVMVAIVLPGKKLPQKSSPWQKLQHIIDSRAKVCHNNRLPGKSCNTQSSPRPKSPSNNRLPWHFPPRIIAFLAKIVCLAHFQYLNRVTDQQHHIHIFIIIIMSHSLFFVNRLCCVNGWEVSRARSHTQPPARSPSPAITTAP